MKRKRKMANRTEILIITTKLQVGGVQSFLLSYVPYIIKAGYDVSFAVQTSEKQEFDDVFLKMGCKIHSVTPITVSKKLYTRDIKEIIKSNKNIRAVYDNQNFLNIYSLLTARKCGVKVRISHSHSCYETKSLKRKIQRAVFKILLPYFATDYFACSVKSAEWLYGGKARSKKCFILSNAVNEEKFSFDEKIRKECRKELGIEGKKTFIHVGTFSDAKNHLFLLRVFSEYLKKNGGAYLILCGDGVLRKDVENKIQELGISDSVMLAGTVNDTEKYLFASDVFVFPSKYEGFGLSVVEAQSSGINCVVSNAVPKEAIFMPNVIKRETFDLEEWIKGIETALSNDFDRKSVGLVENPYSLERNGKILEYKFMEIMK